MAFSLAPFASLLLAVAILLMGGGLLGVLVPLRAHIEAFPPVMIGLIGSAYYAGFVTGCVVGPFFIRRAGHIRTFAALASIAAITALIHSLTSEISVWILVRAATGFCMSGLYMVIESWLNERADNKTRGEVLSVYTIINLTVVAVGQGLLNVAPPDGHILFTLVAILFCLALVPIAMTSALAPLPVAKINFQPKWLFKMSPIGVIGCFAVGLAAGPFWTLGPVFAQVTGHSVAFITAFMSTAVICGAVFQLPLGRLSDRIDRRKLIFAGSLLAASVGLALWHLGNESPATAILYAAAYGAVALPLYSLCSAHANDVAPRDRLVEVNSGLLLAYGIGAVTGPFMASALMGMVGEAALFLFTALAHGLLAVVVLTRMVQRSPVPAGDREPFISIPRTSPEVFVLDPRIDPEPAGAGNDPAVFLSENLK